MRPPSPATSTLSGQPPLFAIVARGSGVERRASGSMGHPRGRQRFESRVQASEIVEIVEDRPDRQSALRGKAPSQ
jgi:hypothetical protein